MYACMLEIGRGFFEVVYASENRLVFSRDPPRHPGPALSEWLYASTPTLRILTLADSHSLLQDVVPSGR
jgi:hypothetical protein